MLALRSNLRQIHEDKVFVFILMVSIVVASQKKELNQDYVFYLE